MLSEQPGTLTDWIAWLVTGHCVGTIQLRKKKKEGCKNIPTMPNERS